MKMLERIRALSFRHALLIAFAFACCTAAVGLGLFYTAGFHSVSEVNWLAVAKRQLAAIPLLFGYTIQFFLFLLPGACVVIHFSKRRTIPSHHILPAAITASALAGYAAFWIYFASPLAGKLLSVTLELACAAYLFSHWKSDARALVVQRDVALPTAFFFFGGLFYIAFLWLFDRALTPDLDAQRRLLQQLPPDNVLPAMLAEKIANGLNPSPLSGDWLSSDRPPLQAGLALLQRPFRIVRWNYNYQILGTIYQAAWIPAVWCLCRTVGYCERRSAWVLFCCLTSGFFLLNTIYVWPKLLAAALVVWSFTLLWEPVMSRRKPSLSIAALAALSAALGFLSHGGVAFTLVALGLFFLIPRYFIGWKQIVAGCIVFLAAYFPWTLYQKFYDPPGNRLLKWYLAGALEIDARTTGQAISDAYSRRSAGEILSMKIDNALSALPDLREKQNVERWRENEFFRILPGLGAVNAGWLGLLICAWRTRKGALNQSERSTLIFIFVAILSLTAWWMLLGGPDLAIIHQGSYATMILLFIGLSGLAISHLPRVLQGIFFGIHLCDFLVVWLLSTPMDMTKALYLRQLNFVMALALVLAATGLIFIFQKTRAAKIET